MLFRRRGADPSFPRGDQGTGSLDDYRSDPHQDVIAELVGAETIETAIARRTAEEERTDAPMPIRLFADGRIVGPVGRVPRGLEAVVNEALSRLDIAGRKPRIPAEIVRTRRGWRVDLHLGATR